MNEIKILVVDDSETNIILMVGLLKQKGYNVITAINGKEALAILETETPDLILLDLMMPQINGFKFLEKKREHSRYSNIPVIVITAKNNYDDRDKAIELGASKFMQKPVRIKYLLKLINEVLEK